MRDFNEIHCEACGVTSARLCDTSEEMAWRRAETLCKAAELVSRYPSSFDEDLAVRRAKAAVQVAICVTALNEEMFPWALQ